MTIRFPRISRTLTLLALSIALIGRVVEVHADTAPPSDVSKKDLVEKLLTLQRSIIEGVADGLIQQPAHQLIQQADAALQTRVAPEQRADVLKGAREDIQKFLDDTTPLVRSKALQAAPLTLGAMLEENFSTEELKQLIAILESPVNRKLHDMGPEMQKRLTEKIISDARSHIEPQIQNLQSRLANRFSAASQKKASTTEPSVLPIKPSQKSVPAQAKPSAP